MRASKSPSPAVTESIARLVRTGTPFTVACGAILGIHWRRGVEWREAAGRDHAPKRLRDFLDAVVRAESESVAALTSIVVRGAVGGQTVSERVEANGARSVKRTAPKTKAAMFLLERGPARDQFRPAGSDIEKAEAIRRLIAFTEKRAATPVEDPRRRLPVLDAEEVEHLTVSDARRLGLNTTVPVERVPVP